MGLGRSVDHNEVFPGHALEIALVGGPVNANHGHGLILADSRPVAGAALWVGINQQHVCAIELQGACKMGGDGGFTRPALLIQYGNDLHVHLLSY